MAYSATEVGINRHDEYVGRGVKTPASLAQNTLTYTLEFRQTEGFPGQSYPCSAMVPLLWLDECNGRRMGSPDPLTAGEDDDTPVPEERRGLSGDLPGHDVLGPGGRGGEPAGGDAPLRGDERSGEGGVSAGVSGGGRGSPGRRCGRGRGRLRFSGRRGRGRRRRCFFRRGRW